MASAGKKWRKGGLRAAFAAAVGTAALATAIFTGAGAVNNTLDQVSPNGPAVVEAFGQSAQKVMPQEDPLRDSWNTMREQQKKGMEDPAKARAYDEFMKQFEHLRDLPLMQQAQEVNKLVNEKIYYYNDLHQYGSDDYWAAPVETVLNGRGDCEDYAILEAAVLRHLGVPEGRMFITGVNTRGYAGDGGDHMILLLNVAPEGAAQDFYILSNSPAFIPADNAVIEKIVKLCDVDRCWKADYALVEARNGEGYWKVQPDTSKPWERNLAGNNAKAGDPKLG